MENPEYALQLLRRVRELGAGLALDDFGAGFTSLSHLQRYRFDTLKVDPSLVRPNGAGGRPAILRSVIAMAHDLGMDVITEGAETESDAVELSQLGCEFAQGYAFGEPMSAAVGAEIDGRRSALVKASAACENRGETFPRLAKPLRRANLGIGMKFSTDFLDEIRARVPVSQVVGARVKLKKSGREWAGLSPFNAEKTPSFFVNDQKGFYHDFSSGKHGDVFTFLMETEGLGFPEAVEKVAAMAGVPMPARSREGEARDQRRAVLHDALVLAAEIFETTLNAPVGAKARGYLSDRGVDPAAQRLFGLGYSAPDRFALREALAARGVELAEMIAAGLLAHGDDVAVAYDRFRDRVMFPIHDRGGKLVAFGGRALDPSARAKYLNSPESELFHKGAAALQPPPRPQGRARARRGDRRRGLCRRHRHDPGGLRPYRRAARHGADQRAVRAVVDDRRRADPVLRRRQGGAQGGLPRRRRRAAAGRAGQEPAIRHAAGGPGPGRSGPFGRRAGDRRGAPRRRAARRAPVRARDGRPRRSTRRKNAPASSGGCANSSARSPTTPCAAITRPTWRAGSAIFSALARPPPPGPGGASAIPAAADGSAVRIPGRGSASPARRCRSRRAASSPRPREAPREIAILAILLGHPGAAGKARRGGGGARIREPRPRAFRDRLLALPGEAFAGAEPLASALAAAGLAEIANASCRRPPARPIGGASVRGGSLGRRTRFAPDSGLATEFGGVK